MIRKLLVSALTALVRGYQLVVSPWFAPTCRYYPSCSAYAIDALKIQGPLKGLYLSAWRLLRCNPWSKGGIDPVPPKKSSRNLGSEPVVEAPAISATVTEPTAIALTGQNVPTVASSAWRTSHGNI